jgi:predicted thioesterase
MNDLSQSSSHIWLSQPLEAGRQSEAKLKVEPGVTAKTIGSGSLDVFATPMMVALMEKAACAVLEGFLAPGWTSVGTLLNITHTVASPLGAQITAQAKITEINDRRVDFELAAFDDAGLIGAGAHSRVFVAEEKLMAKAAKRVG